MNPEKQYEKAMGFITEGMNKIIMGERILRDLHKHKKPDSE